MHIIPRVTIVSGQPPAPQFSLPDQPVELDAKEARRLVDAGFAVLAESKVAINDSKALIESIVDAIAELPTAGFGKDGKPNVKALQGILEFEVTAAQRDAAWEQFQQLTGSTS